MYRRFSKCTQAFGKILHQIMRLNRFQKVPNMPRNFFKFFPNQSLKSERLKTTVQSQNLTKKTQVRNSNSKIPKSSLKMFSKSPKKNDKNVYISHSLTLSFDYTGAFNFFFPDNINHQSPVSINTSINDPIKDPVDAYEQNAAQSNASKTKEEEGPIVVGRRRRLQ